MIPAKNRERKCSTCKHYQPSPLWRKGWCRNPLLYDRNTNHLVEADSLACNRTFIDYWEPMTSQAPAPGAHARSTRPRIAPSIPMGTIDARGHRGTITGNTPAEGMAAVAPRQQPRPADRPVPQLSLVTPEYEELGGDEASKETLQLEQVPAPYDPETEQPGTTLDRIQRGRRSTSLGSLSIAGSRLWLVVGLVAVIVLLGGAGIMLKGRGNKAPVIAASTTPTAPIATPTGFGDATATPAFVPTKVAVPPSNVIGVNGWVQVNQGSRLTLRSDPTTSGSRLRVLASGTKAHVIDGPKSADGYTWWKIDGFDSAITSASGWVAGEYLTPIPPP